MSKAFWNDMADKKGDNVKTLCWPTLERQELSFKALVDNTEFQNTEILDLGCGFCDFYHYLRKKNIDVVYHGIDLSDKIINISKKKEKNNIIKDNIKCTNFLDNNYNIMVDYVVICGTFNIKTENNFEFIKSVIDKAYKCCKKGVVFTLITTYVDFMEDYLYYADPSKIIDLCKKYTPYVNMINDYNKFEYLMIMYKPN